jgi:hypothetical protein
LPIVGKDSVLHSTDAVRGGTAGRDGKVGASHGGEGVLSEQERQVWDDVQRFWTVTTEEPPGSRRAVAASWRRPRRDHDDAPLWAVGGFAVAIVLVLFGAVVAGLALAAAFLLGWALWRCWPGLTRADTGTPAPQLTGEEPEGR